MSKNDETGDTFEWKDGKLQPFSLPEEQVIRDGDTDDEWFKRIGYKWEGNMGTPGVHQVRWFRRIAEGDGHPFAAILDEFDWWRVVFLPSFDALLQFRSMIAPMISQGMLEMHLAQLDQIASKSFRVWHGHHETRACEKCDPDEMARMRVEEGKRNKADPTRGLKDFSKT